MLLVLKNAGKACYPFNYIRCNSGSVQEMPSFAFVFTKAASFYPKETHLILNESDCRYL